jgi:hypothetical protein
VLFQRAWNRPDTPLIIPASRTTFLLFTAIYLHIRLTTLLRTHAALPHPHSPTSLTQHPPPFRCPIALPSYHPNPTHERAAPCVELRAARRRATTRSFQHSYRHWRPMVERSLAWLVADGCRRVPYRGIGRNDLWWSLRVAAVNLRRLLALGLTHQDQTWVLA